MEGAETANRRALETDVAEGDRLLLLQRKQNKGSATYDPDPYSVVSKKGDLVVIERGESILKRNVAHVKRFIGSTPQIQQPQHVGMQPLAELFVQQPVIKKATFPVPQPIKVFPEEPVTKPTLECSPQSFVGKCQNGPANLEDRCGREMSQGGLRTMLLERMS